MDSACIENVSRNTKTLFLFEAIFCSQMHSCNFCDNVVYRDIFQSCANYTKLSRPEIGIFASLRNDAFIAYKIVRAITMELSFTSSRTR